MNRPSSITSQTNRENKALWLKAEKLRRTRYPDESLLDVYWRVKLEI